MRYLPVVLEHVLTIIPKAKRDLRADLRRVMESARYAPPQSNYNWIRAAYVLSHYLGNDKPTGGWALRVWNIMLESEAVPGAEIPASSN